MVGLIGVQWWGGSTCCRKWEVGNGKLMNFCLYLWTCWACWTRWKATLGGVAIYYFGVYCLCPIDIRT